MHSRKFLMAPTFFVRNASQTSSRNRVFSHQGPPVYQAEKLLNLTVLGKQHLSNVAPLVITPLSREFPVEETACSRRLIIIDWDDTINPSSWCMKNGILTVRQPTRNDLQVIRDLSQKAAKTLTMCLAHGHVVIVTNAETGWVELSAKSLMPDVARYVAVFFALNPRLDYFIRSQLCQLGHVLRTLTGTPRRCGSCWRFRELFRNGPS